MISLIKKINYKKQLWKNGQGSTLQMAIFPKDAELTKNDFLWRISSASVRSSGPFSLFWGFERQLIVWKGQGLILNSVPLLPYDPITFSGDTDIQCELINDEQVVDFGVIYNKSKISSRIYVQKLLNDSSIKLETGCHFIFLAEGASCLINNIKMETGDSLQIENNEIQQFQFQTNILITLFIISLKSI